MSLKFGNIEATNAEVSTSLTNNSNTVYPIISTDSNLFTLSSSDLITLYGLYILKLSGISLPNTFFGSADYSAPILFDATQKRFKFITNNSTEKYAVTLITYNNQDYKVEIYIYKELVDSSYVNKATLIAIPVPVTSGGNSLVNNYY